MLFRIKLIVILFMLSLYSTATFAKEEPKEEAKEETKTTAKTATKPPKYINPLKIPVSLSGNFGEIRSTHFHSGLDFKTQGVEGQPIRAIADGYISRLFVSPYGYGKAIYLSHPTLGTMSVYGHLSRFMPSLSEYVEAYQYRNKRFNADLYPSKEKFKVKQGDIIGYSGNSGSSGGAHLHFEIRDAATSNTLSPIATCGIKVNDTVAPTITSLTVVELDYTYGIAIHKIKKRYPVKLTATNQYTISEVVTSSKDCYFAFEVTEKKSNSGNIFGVASLRLSNSKREIWGYSIDRLSYSYGRATYNMLLYPETMETKNDIIRTYISPTNTLPIYTTSTKNGVIDIEDIIVSDKFTLKATDEHGNSSTLTFTAKADSLKTPPFDRPAGELIIAEDYFNHNTEDIKLIMPAYSIQQSVYTAITSTIDSLSPLSKIVEFAENQAPFIKNVTLSIKSSDIKNIDTSKLLIVSISEKDNREDASVGGVYKDGYVTTKVSRGGKYKISADTIPPVINATHAKGAAINGNTLTFNISDNLSGISKYNGYIDGKWILFDYDAKKNKIIAELKPTKIAKGGKHTCKIAVSDSKGNKAIHNTTFIW